MIFNLVLGGFSVIVLSIPRQKLTIFILHPNRQRIPSGLNLRVLHVFNRGYQLPILRRDNSILDGVNVVLHILAINRLLARVASHKGLFHCIRSFGIVAKEFLGPSPTPIRHIRG